MKTIKPKSVIEILQTIDGGGALEELKEKIEFVSQKVKERGGKGSVTLKLTFAKVKNSPRRLDVTDSVSTTIPARPAPPTVFYATDDGKLVRDDPDQFKLLSVNELEESND